MLTPCRDLLVRRRLAGRPLTPTGSPGRAFCAAARHPAVEVTEGRTITVLASQPGRTRSSVERVSSLRLDVLAAGVVVERRGSSTGGVSWNRDRPSSAWIPGTTDPLWSRSLPRLRSRRHFVRTL